MMEKQLSSQYTVVLQGIICSFSAFFLFGIWFLLRNVTLDASAWAIVSGITVFVIIINWQLLTFADIYICLDQIVCKKITGVKRRPLSEIKTIDEGIMPNTYYLEFKDDSKVYFQLKTGDLLDRIIGSNTTDIIDSLRKCLNIK